MPTTAKHVVRGVAGVTLVLLGSLWVLQGADLVRIRPILCVADCEPLTGGSPTWFVIGIVSVVAGIVLLVRPSISRRRAREESS
ncbi:hypothetical protein CLV56_0394 [Mumia flava]|uniref:Uncharacterized protein n=1 Tax=Mumia flava TaxID=1348852 RepID=A0A0B2BRB4_9ACTN|nr:hypothetical protein [Mumia flava]PJJ56190.1 hypothetical protein CLV56_0394 [Mumia flava]